MKTHLTALGVAPAQAQGRDEERDVRSQWVDRAAQQVAPPGVNPRALRASVRGRGARLERRKMCGCVLDAWWTL